MADVFSATDPLAKAGANPTSLACCAEFVAKMLMAQGAVTMAAKNKVAPKGQMAMLKIMPHIPIQTMRGAPKRSTWRDIQILPNSPKAPNHINKALSCKGEIANLAL